MYCIGKASPDRLYRVALLRNHFSDTILKAREKALKKGDKRDPEKVRMEREELERQQREGWSLYIDDSTIIVEKTTARDGNDDGTDGGELRTTTNGSPDALLTTSRNPRPFPMYYLRRRENLGLFRRTTCLSRCTLTASEKPRPWEYPLFPT
uniref:Uncharacterized protein n=1 Tax=Cucumis melo TaxID=3656 RepID=A0A9I9EHQ1_CUCME